MKNTLNHQNFQKKLGGGGKQFNLETFLAENNIDRNDPMMAEKIKNFEASIKKQQNLTKSLLLDLLAFHGISYTYINKSTKELNRDNTRNPAKISSETEVPKTENHKNMVPEIKPEIWENLQKTPEQKPEDTPESEKIITNIDNTKKSQNISENDSNKSSVNSATETTDQKPKASENISVKKLTQETQTKIPENISQAEKIEANRLWEQIQKEFSELKNTKMSEWEIEKFLQQYNFPIQEKTISVKKDIPLITDITGMSRTKKQTEKYIKIENEEIPFRRINSVKEIQGNLYAYVGWEIIQLQEKPENSLDNFTKNLQTRTQVATEVEFSRFGQNWFSRDYLKQVPVDGFKKVNLKWEKDVKFYDLSQLRTGVFNDNLFKNGDATFTFRSWNGLVAMNASWEYLYTYFVNKNAGYSQAEIEEYNQSNLQRYKSFQEVALRMEIERRTEKERDLAWQNQDNEAPLGISNHSIIQQGKPQTKNTHNPNDYYDGGYRIQKSGNTMKITDSDGGVSVIGWSGQVCSDGKCWSN